MIIVTCTCSRCSYTPYSTKIMLVENEQLRCTFKGMKGVVECHANVIIMYISLITVDVSGNSIPLFRFCLSSMLGLRFFVIED